MDWRNEHLDRVNWLLISIKGALIPDGPLGQSPALWQYTCVITYSVS